MLAAIIVITVGLVAYALTKDTDPKIPEPKTVQEALTRVSPNLAPRSPESPKPSPRSLAAPAAPLPLPRYPVGLEMRFQGKKATIKKAWQDGQGGWHFLVDVDAGMPLGIGNMKDKAVSEQFVRDTLANQLKQTLAPDQAFPVNVEVYRNGKGGLIESVIHNTAGLWQYRIKGWPEVVSQGQLLDLLVKA